jgi:hypothetical protein
LMYRWFQTTWIVMAISALKAVDDLVLVPY